MEFSESLFSQVFAAILQSMAKIPHSYVSIFFYTHKREFFLIKNIVNYSCDIWHVQSHAIQLVKISFC